MNIQLISSILNNVWAIDEQSAQSYFPLITNLLGNTVVKVDFVRDEADQALYSYSLSPLVTAGTTVRNTTPYSWQNKWGMAPKNSIAVLSMRGPLMKNDQFCGPLGMASIGDMIKEANQAQNIDGILLRIDSPGGTVDGTEELATIVSNSKKPVVAFADGLMASAAFWIGSAASEIVAATGKTKIGSVGVVMSFQDIQPALEKMGVKFHNIVASQSQDKNKMFDEIRSGNYENYRKSVLDPIASDFINAVKANIPGITDDLLTGKVHFAEALSGSVVDSIGDLDSAIARLNALIDSNINSVSNSNSQKNPSMELTALNAILGLDANPESTDEGTHFNNDQLTIINTALQAHSENTDAVTTARAERDALQLQLDAANQTIATLKKNPGSETTQVIVKKDAIKSDPDQNVSSNGKSFLENMEAVGEEYLGN